MYKYLFIAFIVFPSFFLSADEEEPITKWVGYLEEDEDVADRRDDGPTFYDRNKWALERKWERRNRAKICERMNRDGSCAVPKRNRRE